MALAPISSDFLSPTPSCSSLCLINFRSKPHCLNNFRTLKFRVSCSQQAVQLETPVNSYTIKKKRKPRPSFSEQIRLKWSVKTPISRELPWQQQKPISDIALIENAEDDDDEEVRIQSSEDLVSDPVSYVPRNQATLPPWVHGNQPNKTQKTHFDSLVKNPQESDEIDGSRISFGDNVSRNAVQELRNGGDELSTGFAKRNEIRPLNVVQSFSYGEKSSGVDIPVLEDSKGETEFSVLPEQRKRYVRLEKGDRFRQTNGIVAEKSSDVDIPGFEDSTSKSDLIGLPWEDITYSASEEDVGLRKGNAWEAEKVIPEPDLKRLRNVALRMAERIKVGAAGITEALVDSIHEKWKEDEVVKLKFEGPQTLNMKRTHRSLESRTGGLVIWRSGSSVVLYRGMSYKLRCVQSYTKQVKVNLDNSESSQDTQGGHAERFGFKDSVKTRELSSANTSRYTKGLTEKEITKLRDFEHLLDDLGPRFRDWSGCEPIPVDADLLPSVVPGYKPPFRILPHGVRPGLKDKATTVFRRAARTMPPHFALGRNRELQGLAVAMVKLWEKTAIAKIAIKRGVHNTCNERMAEELKRLTGGVLLSRNKDYIVFYRGNDFMPPVVTEKLVEARKLTVLKQDEEEEARQRASTLIHSGAEASRSPLVAGTLAETMAATSRWGNQPSSKDIEKMLKDLALSRHASLVRCLEKKLALAKGKLTKAEKALYKVQESLEPAELPTDLETITDEERFLFRKMGLSMKPFLCLGTRGVFDGTVENIHLHWKFRELVKIIVQRKNLAQIKHIAISLEAESGGVLVSVDKTMKGHAIILYRGKNYQRPQEFRPKNLLTKRQAFTRSIELQRCEALKHHASDIMGKIETLKSELEAMKNVKEIDEETFHSRMDYASSSDDEIDDSDDEIEDGDDEIIEVDDEMEEVNFWKPLFSVTKTNASKKPGEHQNLEYLKGLIGNGEYDVQGHISDEILEFITERCATYQ